MLQDIQDSGREPGKEKSKSRLLWIIIISILCTSVAWGCLLFVGYRIIRSDLQSLKQQQTHNQENQIKTNQLLLSAMDWSTRRQRLILFMRESILREWKVLDRKADVGRAYDYAETIVKNSEGHPQVDPLLMLALIRVESRFCPELVSAHGARGLVQMLPATARPYFEIMGYTYTDTALHNPNFNIKAGIRYMDHLSACYPSLEKALAFYNGGGKAAAYYPDSMKAVPEETQKFVPNVIGYWKEYTKEYEKFKVDSLMTKRQG